MWPMWQSALLWRVLFQPDNHETVGLWSLQALALIVSALLSVCGGAANRENLMSRQRYSFYKSVEVSFLGGCKSPHIQQQPVLDGFLAGPVGPGRPWQGFASLGGWAGDPCESQWMANVSEKRLSHSPLKKRNLKLTDKWSTSHVWQLLSGPSQGSKLDLNLKTDE